MHNFGSYLLWVLSACSLWQGSLTEDLRSGNVSYVGPSLSLRRPFLLKQVVLDADQGITSNADNESKRNLEVKIQSQGVEAKLEGKLQELQAKVEESQAKHGAKLECKLLELQAKVEESQAKLEARLEGQQTVLTQIGSQLKEILSKIEAPRQAAKVEVPDFVSIAPSGFERIGTRYFRIVNEKLDWETAERRCREMEGYLASFRNDEEFTAITARLKPYNMYWLGINNRDTEGHLVSVASNKPPQFLKWFFGKRVFNTHTVKCVYMFINKMWETDCTKSLYFICQADNET